MCMCFSLQNSTIGVLVIFYREQRFPAGQDGHTGILFLCVLKERLVAFPFFFFFNGFRLSDSHSVMPCSSFHHVSVTVSKVTMLRLSNTNSAVLHFRVV